MNEKIITLEGIKKYYGSGAGRQQVLFDVDFAVTESSLVSVVGTSGSGKSTLLNIIGGLDRNFEGKVVVDGTNFNGLADNRISVLRNKTIGFIFQSFNLLDHLTCWENVALPGFFDRNPTTNARGRAVEVLERLGLGNKVDVKPGNLSGGQKQRVAIARALFNRPKILLCDEPTGNLDTKTGAQIISLFQELNEKDGITLILVTHENRLSKVAHRVIRLEDGKIVNEFSRKTGDQEFDPADMEPSEKTENETEEKSQRLDSQESKPQISALSPTNGGDSDSGTSGEKTKREEAE